MDNLTHSFAGLLLAEAALAWRPSGSQAPSTGVRWAALGVSCASNNLPDLDFVYAGITQPRSLGYLLHHRGHTHTLPIGLLLGALTFAAALAALRLARAAPAPRDRLLLLALSLLGPLVHVAMDLTNNYGVHPFWPIYDGWFYGDSVFIVEPWLWVAMLPALAFSAQSRIGRALLALFSAVALGLAWTVDLVAWGASLALSAGAALATYAAWRLGPRGRAAQGLIASAGVIGAFAVCMRVAEARVERALWLDADERRAGTAIADVVVTPTVANPLCASAIVLGTRGDEYFARKAVVASVPALFPAAGCRVEPSDPTAPFAAVRASGGAAVRWAGEWSAPRAELERLAREHCAVSALLRFARAPYWVRDGRRLIAGDLRYDREPGLDFADLETSDSPARCPERIPPWTPPRSDLLRR